MSKPTIPRAAARAELRRRKLEGLTFRAHVERYGPVPAHLDALVGALEGLPAGGLRLSATMPPGGAKSTTVVRALAWLLSKRPHLRVLFASYSTRLARHHVRALRAELHELGVPLDRDGSSTSLLRLEAGGYVAAVSIGGGTGTGLRADVLVVDDICGSRSEAESAALRERAERWYRSVARTRVEPGTGSVVFVTTRWRRDDLVGTVLDGPTGASWTRLHAPAIDEHGESYWPDRVTRAELEAIREELGERDWSALYMGAPMDDVGQLFRGVTFTSEAPPDAAVVSLGLDVAYSARTSSDWTVAIALAFDAASRRAWVIAAEWHRGTLETVAPHLGAFSRTGGGRAFAWAASGTEAAAIAPVLRERGVPIRERPAVADKVSRAARVSGAWCEGRVLVPRGAPWADRLVRELAAFPGGRHDDAIDAIASAYDEVAHAAILHEGPVAFPAGFVTQASRMRGGFAPAGRTRPTRLRFF